MPPSISKYKLYLYLFFFIFLSSIFNFKFLENFNDKFRLDKINIYGLPNKEKKLVESELIELKNLNIFNLSEDIIFDKLNKFNFLESIHISRIIPSTLNINLSKTSIIGKTMINGEKFYIGSNEKFININQLLEKNNVPSVFGDFKVKEYIDLMKILNDHRIDLDDIEKYYYFKNKRWDILFSKGFILKLPSIDVEKSVKTFKRLLDNGNLINIKTIDFRSTNQIVLTNKNE